MVYMPAGMRFDAYPNFLFDPSQKDTIPTRFVPADHSPEAAVGRVRLEAVSVSRRTTSLVSTPGLASSACRPFR